MAITKSAQKSIRQTARHRAGNLVYKNKMKKLLKEARFLVSEKKNKEAEKMLPEIYKILDKSVKVGIIKKNAAARTKSRLTKLINSKI